MYKPQATLFQATLYFKNTLYSVARGFAVNQKRRLLFETGVAEVQNEKKIILQMMHFTTFALEMPNKPG